MVEERRSRASEAGSDGCQKGGPLARIEHGVVNQRDERREKVSVVHLPLPEACARVATRKIDGALHAMVG